MAPDLPDCMLMTDRPPGNNHPWTFTGPADADVVWGVRPAASWDGSAALLSVGPGGGCEPCTVGANDYGSLFRTAAELALEVELGCDAVVMSRDRTFSVAGIRLNLHGTEDGAHVSLVDLPVLLTTVDPRGDACVTDNSTGDSTREIRVEAMALEPGHTLTYRVPLGPLVERAGHDPNYMTIGLYDVRLEVNALPGSSGWIELGRTLVDGCL